MKNQRYLCNILLKNKYYAVFADENHQKHFLQIADGKLITPEKEDLEYLNFIYNNPSFNFNKNIDLKELAKRFKVSLIVLTLILTGCTTTNQINDHQNIEPTIKEVTTESQIEASTEFETTIATNEIEQIHSIGDFDTLANVSQNIIFCNEYKDYKEYLTNPAPSYDLLYQTLGEKSENEIPYKYKLMFFKVFKLFEANGISPNNLAIFYENLQKLVINTNYQVTNGEENSVIAFFSPDLEKSSITVDPNVCDFNSFLHECIHSCKEAILKKDDKIIIVSSLCYRFDSSKNLISFGNCYSEGNAEYLTNYLSNEKSNISSSNGYKIANDILEFWLTTQDTDINDIFSSSVISFKNSLKEIGFTEEEIDTIIDGLDVGVLTLNAGGEADLSKIRLSFYEKYIPKLINIYLEKGMTSKEIYLKIGNALKNSIIEKTRDTNELFYRSTYLESQKELFDLIDQCLFEVLYQNGKLTYTINDYIGNFFETYYTLYGKDSYLMNQEKYYLGYNWDEKAVLDSSIFFYVENNKVHMCSYADNYDGTVSCYTNEHGLPDIAIGMPLSELVNLGTIKVENGYLVFLKREEEIIQIIKQNGIKNDYHEESVSISNDKYICQADSKILICNSTKNTFGDKIPYLIYDGGIYILPDGTDVITSVTNLMIEGIASINKDGKLDIDSSALLQYISYIKENQTLKLSKEY